MALPVWPAHQLRRYLGETSVRGPIVVSEQEEKKDNSCQRDRGKRKGQGGESLIGEVADFWYCRHQQRARKMVQASVEKLDHAGSAKKGRVSSVPQREQLASTSEPPLPKGTESSVQSRRSLSGKRVKVSLGEKGGLER